MKHLAITCLITLTLLPGKIIPAAAQSGTDKQTGESLPNCDRQRAIYLVQQQADEVKRLDKPASAVTILINAGNLLWKYNEDAARSIFAQAYEVATKYFEEKGIESRKLGNFVTEQIEDQRFVVMRAIARHDTHWAKRLAERIEDETKREAQKAGTLIRDTPSAIDNLVDLASSMVTENQQVAIGLIKTSFNYPASFKLPSFLFKLASTDREVADRLYEQAVTVYGNGPIESLFYLSVYPFALNRPIGPTTVTVFYRVPRDFAPNANQQKLFLDALFRRARILSTASVDVISHSMPDQFSYDTYRMKPFLLPETAKLYIALNRLDPIISQFQPLYVEKAMEIKDLVTSILYSDVRLLATELIQPQRPPEPSRETLSGYVEKAEREASPVKRDELYSLAVLNAPSDESLDRLRGFAQKIGDARIRQQLLDWLYFTRAQQAAKQGLLDEAAQLASKVEQLDHRTYLSFEIAAESIKRFNDKSRAREMLDAVVATTSKAPNTNEKVRALLGVVHLYTKLDHVRAFEIMKDTIKVINNISEPDFSGTTLSQIVEGPSFGQYITYEVAAFSLENSFRQLGAIHFDDTLLLAQSLENKFLRSVAIIALSAFCLEKIDRQQRTTGPIGDRTSN